MVKTSLELALESIVCIVFNMLAFSTVLGLFMKMIFGGTGGNKDG
jgi:hypothetical protein